MGTGVLGLLGGESRIGMYGVAQTRTRLFGRRTLRPQAKNNKKGTSLAAASTEKSHMTTCSISIENQIGGKK